LLLGALLLAALAAGLLVLAKPAWAFPGTNGKIAFETNRNDNFEIYTVNPDGTGLTRLTNNAATDIDPIWSPNGQRIAFVSDRNGNFEIYVMNADGSNQTRLTNNAAVDKDPFWSPDGTRIAFESNRDGSTNSEIYVMNADGSGQTRITNNPAFDYDPVWSPNGQKIAFESNRVASANFEIYTINPAPESAANQPQRLTNNAAVDIDPTWSPDSTKIAFASFRNGNDNPEIYSMNSSDGSGLIRLTTNTAIEDREPGWSPDGTRIAFQTDRNGNLEIYSMDSSNGSGPARITNNAARDEDPDWGTQGADVSIVKTAPAQVLAGQTFTYGLGVTNAGPGTATGVRVTDTLPNDVTLDGPLPAGCASTGANPITVTCDLGTVNAGQTVTRNINVRAPPQPGTISNTATVSSPNDPNTANNSSTATTVVVAAADLSITKADSPDPVTVGEPLTYTLTVTNGGPNQATNAVIQDILPANATFVSASPGCTESGGVVTCNLGNLANGASATREIVVQPTAPGTLNNEATVDSDTADPNEGNNTATATTQVNVADLSISKSDNPDPVTYGNNLTYGISVTNDGAARARDVTVTDQLPDDVTFVSASAGCDYDAPSHTVTCDLNTINAGQTVTRQIVVRPTATAIGTTLTNQVTVSSPNDPADSTAVATTQVVAADLSVTKTDNEDPVFAGDNFTYILEVANAGAGDATNVQVTDTLPAAVEFVSASAGCDYHAPSHTVTCDLGTIDSGDPPVERRITVTAPDDPTTLENTATVSSPNDPTDSGYAEQTTVAASANLRIIKTAPAEVTDEDTFTYTLEVRNAGPSAAQDVRITDQLPARVEFVSAQGCAEAGGTVTCNIGTLASGETAQRQITVRAKTPGQATNTATVDSTTTDRNPNNNSDTATTQINAAADLAIDKQAPAEVADEDEFVYTLTVTNDGPSDAEGTVVTDQLPDGVEFVSSVDCQNNAGTVTCNLGTLASGETVVVEIRVLAKTPGGKDNTATVESSTDDPDDQNNSDTAITVVWSQPTYSADLAIEKRASPEPVTVGNKLTYTLTVENGGPDVATGVVVRDHLPRDVTFVSASRGCRNSRSTVTCNVGRMADGASVTRKIVVRVRKAGELRNTATVEGETKDRNPANNADTETTTAKPAPKPDPSPACTIKGNDRDNVLHGTPADDVICGRGGDDSIEGRGGDDTIRGDSGNDVLRAGRGNDTVIGGSGRDTHRGEGGNDRLNARDGVGRNDTLNGGAGRDNCTADRGDPVSGCP
jgi:uncharacterized repeat protein (TIGR01451 family)